MKTILTLTLCLIFQMSYAQNIPWSAQSLKPGWERIYISNVGYIDMPKTMEIPSGTYKSRMNSLHNRYEVESPELVFQQKGLSTYSSGAFKKYGRVLLHTIDNPHGDYERLNFNIYSWTSADKQELNQIMKTTTLNDLNTIGHKLIYWYPSKLEKINGMSCIHVKYKRQMGNNPVVIVHQYYFQNVDMMNILIISYRVNETNYWKPDFDRVLSSFRITNIR